MKTAVDVPTPFRSRGLMRQAIAEGVRRRQQERAKRTKVRDRQRINAVLFDRAGQPGSDTGVPSRLDNETVANVFARAYTDTGNIADAFWVTLAIVRRRSTADAGAVGINEVVEAVARARDVRPQAILGRSRAPLVCEARFEVWWRLRQRQPPLSFPAIGAAFGRDHSAIIKGVQKFEAMMSMSADLAARMNGEAEQWRRAA